MPLHTSFHAVVDGTTGDTYLQPVHALLQRSTLTATGSITRKPGVPGHDVELDVVINQGRIEDFLALGVRTSPAILRGALTAHTRIAIPQGPGTVTRRMKLQGSFHVEQASFSNAKLQQQIDDLSASGRGAGRRRQTSNKRRPLPRRSPATSSWRTRSFSFRR